MAKPTKYVPSAVRLMALLGELRELLLEIGPELLPKETETLVLEAHVLAWNMEKIAGRVRHRVRMLERHAVQAGQQSERLRLTGSDG